MPRKTARASPVYPSAGLGPAGDQAGWAPELPSDLRAPTNTGGPRPAESGRRFATQFENPLLPGAALVGLNSLLGPMSNEMVSDADAAMTRSVTRNRQAPSAKPGSGSVFDYRAQVGSGVAGLHVPARIHEHGASPGQAAMPLPHALTSSDGHGNCPRPLWRSPLNVDDRSRTDQVANGFVPGSGLGKKWQAASMCVPLCP